MRMFLRPRQPSMAAEPVSPEVAPMTVSFLLAAQDEIFKQAPKELQREIFKGQRRPVKQLEQEFIVIQLVERRNRTMAEGGIGFFYQSL